MYQKLKLILLLCFAVQCTSSLTKKNRNGRQLDLDAIIEGRLSNHVIGERQSKMLNDKNVTSSDSIVNSTDLSINNKEAKLLDEEETMQKHSSFVSHYASEEELSKSEDFKKSIESLEQLLGTSPRIVNNLDSNNNQAGTYPQASSMVPVSYLNPSYPSEDKILAALINQAATNIVNSQQTNDLSAVQSNPSPIIYGSSADKPLPMNPSSSSSSGGGLSSFLNIGGNTNKKKPFASISSSIQEFAASIFPNRVTNKFIKRKQNGQSLGNQLDFTSSSECICVPYYMCRKGYIEQNAVRPSSNQQSPLTINKFDQNKISTNGEPSVADLIENSGSSQLNKYYDPQQLTGLMMISPEDMQAFQKQQQEMLMATSSQQNIYSSGNLNVQQPKDAKQEKLQNSPSTLSMKIDKRSQLSNNDLRNVQKFQENKNTNSETMAIDERSIDGSKTDTDFATSTDANQTESALEINPAELEALTRMVNSPQAAPSTFATSTTMNDQESCGILRTCCPIGQSIPSSMMSPQSLAFLQAHQSQFQPSNSPMFAFENFQPSFIDPQSHGIIQSQFNQHLSTINSPSQAQSSQNNFVYQPIYQGESSFSGPSLSSMNSQINSQINPHITGSSTINTKKPLSNQFNSISSQSNNQMLNINNQMVSNQMANNNPMMGNQMVNGQMMPQQFTPLNKWLQNDRINYQPNMFVQPSLSSYLLTNKPNYQARNPPSEFYVNGNISDEKRFVATNQSNKNFTTYQCGRRPQLQINFNIDTYPIGTAPFGKYGWAGMLLRKLDDSKSMFGCGATLISDQWVLTANHCLRPVNYQDSAKDFKVRFGEFDMYSEDEPYPFVERNIEEIIRHPDYDSFTLRNDIALLKIEPIDLASNPHIVPVCRASYGENFAGRKCYLSGFGKSDFKGSYQSVMREVELPILDHSVCASQLQKTRLGSNFVLHHGFMCAGSEPGKDACTGDGGSALVCEESVSGISIWKAVGIVSWGINCGQASVPGVYANIGYYQNWIDNTINSYENKNNVLINSTSKEQFKDHNTLNMPSTEDLLSESSNLYESIIQKSQKPPNSTDKRTVNSSDLLSIINERAIKDQTELSISS